MSVDGSRPEPPHAVAHEPVREIAIEIAWADAGPSGPVGEESAEESGSGRAGGSVTGSIVECP